MPTIKGTGSIADDRARTKLVRSTKFPASFSRRVDTTRAHRDILTQWIEDRITALLGGLEDEIVQSMAVNLFLPPVPEDGAPPAAVDPKLAQVDLAAFLGEKESAIFCRELWELLLDAQDSPGGIPRKLLEAKKAEMAKERAQQVQQQQAQAQAQAAAGARRGFSSGGPAAAAWA